MGWYRRLSPQQKSELAIHWQQKVRKIYADLISKNEVSIDWDNFKLDRSEERR